MNTDSLRTARRIRQDIESPGDIQNAFDGLTYWTGGALVTMFERYIGPDAFRAGIRSYVAAHKNGLGSTDELLEAVGRAADATSRRPSAASSIRRACRSSR